AFGEEVLADFGGDEKKIGKAAAGELAENVIVGVDIGGARVAEEDLGDFAEAGGMPAEAGGIGRREGLGVPDGDAGAIGSGGEQLAADAGIPGGVAPNQ